MGADAHLAQISVNAANSTRTSTFGWDGDDLLYSANGAQLSIAIEKLGILVGTTAGNASWFSIYDRDWSGGLANVHEASGFSAVNVLSLKVADCTVIAPREIPQPGSGPGGIPTPPPPAPTPAPTASPNPKTPQVMPSSRSACGLANAVSAGGPSIAGFTPMIMGYPTLGAEREDGYSDGINVFQGVRSYDPNMNQWTTPDAYAGDVHDPMSQKPYMWNGNNPVSYSDPSGYATESAIDFGLRLMLRLGNLTYGGDKGTLNRSGNLSGENISRIARYDMPRGTLQHIQKFQEGLRSLNDMWRAAGRLSDKAMGQAYQSVISNIYDQKISEAEQETGMSSFQLRYAGVSDTQEAAAPRVAGGSLKDPLDMFKLNPGSAAQAGASKLQEDEGFGGELWLPRR